MGDVVNLNRARKDRAAGDRKAEAGRNRLLHGRTRAEREAAKAQVEKAARDLDGHRRDGKD